MLPPNIVKFNLFFIFANPNFMCLTCVVKKCEFWLHRLRGIHDFGTPKFCQILSFLYIYLPKKFHVTSVKG